ncbi:MAG TPA: M23 family metallopeptidase [Smithellaceae bacterium]|nr:M23 family metallopeptidase [Smithellaceae bacterium]
MIDKNLMVNIKKACQNLWKQRKPGNLFTLMIIPRSSSTVKKITIPTYFARSLGLFFFVAFVVFLYFIYDYASIKRDKAELQRLRVETKEQARQVKDLALKVDEFADRMEELRQFDKKIRILASYQTARDKKMPLGIGGAVSSDVRLKELLDSDNQKIVAEMRRNLSAMNEDANYREQSFNELLSFLREQKSILAATPSLWPVRGWVTSEFGMRESPFSSGVEFHNGIDIATRYGKEIIAPADGLVVEASNRAADGNYIKIDHGHGYATLYCHLSKFAVKEGMRVKRGDVIAYVGDTGRSTGSHLHYTVLVNNVSVNPRRYLKR